jgi:epoxyqueuosine reductase QueG
MSEFEASKNTERLRMLFRSMAKDHKLRGILGIAKFKTVYDSLMDVQKEKLRRIVGERFQSLSKDGKFVSIAYVYPDGIADLIGIETEGGFDKDSWNIYAKWYGVLNNALNKTSEKLAEELEGFPIPATKGGIAAVVNHVHEYFPDVISHRVHAEKAGLGWRGKNSLIINPKYSCLIRLAAVITELPLILTSGLEDDCGDCTSCFEVCTFLKHMDKLDDYREQCRRYLDSLKLDDEVCGKCIKACVYSPRLSKPQGIPVQQKLENVFYTNYYS